MTYGPRNDLVCHTCRVYLDTESEHIERFSEVHRLCRVKLMTCAPVSRMPPSPRWSGTSYKDTATMTDVGRTLVENEIVARLMKQVKAIDPSKEFVTINEREREPFYALPEDESTSFQAPEFTKDSFKSVATIREELKGGQGD